MFRDPSALSAGMLSISPFFICCPALTLTLTFCVKEKKKTPNDKLAILNRTQTHANGLRSSGFENILSETVGDPRQAACKRII